MSTNIAVSYEATAQVFSFTFVIDITKINKPPTL